MHEINEFKKYFSLKFRNKWSFKLTQFLSFLKFIFHFYLIALINF